MSTNQPTVGDDSYTDMLPDFLDEAQEHLQRLNEHLLRLDEELKATGTSRFDGDVLNEMFRAAHTLKGLSGMLGLHNINALTHRIENVFDAARGDELRLTSEVVEVVFESVDRLAEMVARLEEGKDDAVECGSVLDEIARVLERNGVERLPASQLDVERAMQSSATTVETSLVIPDPDTFQPGEEIGDRSTSEVEVAIQPVAEPDSTIGGAEVSAAPAKPPSHAGDVFADVQDDADLSSKYISVFVDEAELTLDQVTEALLASADENLTEEILVLCHRMKGSAATVGLQRAAKLAHVMEDLLQVLHERRGELSVEMTDAMLDCTEALRVFVGGLKSGQLQTDHFVGAHQKLARSQITRDSPPVTAGESPAEVQTPTGDRAAADAASAPQELPSTPAASRAADGHHDAAKPAETVRVDIDRLDQLMNLAGELVVNKARLTQISNGLRQLVADRRGDQAITNVLGSLQQFSDVLDSLAQRGPAAARLEDVSGLARRIQSEMAAVRHRMSQMDEARQSISKLLEAVDQLERVSYGIQKSVMDTRMVPIGPLLARFKRVIRDIGRSKAKEIRLIIRGEKTELDKRMIDELGDPLIHVVRNSADHGIEMPDDRVAAGKPREGTVILDASHGGNSIVIKIMDDGRGLDAGKIRDTAVRKGLLAPAAAQQLTDQQLYQLIWQPGLSTADKVSEVSGRGMGMDIVRSTVEALHGTIELESEFGQGTTITIKLPLTMAILPSLLAKIDGNVFAIPIESVTEVVRVATEDLRQVLGLDTTIVRGRVISVVRLCQLLAWHADAAGSTVEESRDHQTVVIVGNNGQEIGLVVDRLLGEEDIVVKSLAENYHNVEGIAGASVLADGRVSLILDVGALVERASSQ